LKFNSSVGEQVFGWRPPEGTRRVQM